MKDDVVDSQRRGSPLRTGGVVDSGVSATASDPMHSHLQRCGQHGQGRRIITGDKRWQ